MDPHQDESQYTVILLTLLLLVNSFKKKKKRGRIFRILVLLLRLSFSFGKYRHYPHHFISQRQKTTHLLPNGWYIMLNMRKCIAALRLELTIIKSHYKKRLSYLNFIVLLSFKNKIYLLQNDFKILRGS